MRWTWTAEKNRTNQRDHGLSFATAQRAFDDPLPLSRPDPYPDRDRWQTLALVGPVIPLVIHTWPEPTPETAEPTGRIISARKATAHERRAYEEARY